MREFNVTAEELEVLTQLLQQSLTNLEREILHTDHAEFRESLKGRRRVVEGMLNRLRQPDQRP